MSGAEPASPDGVRRLRLAFAFETFLGATLLFGLEPMVGRMLLPTFGGAYYVWTTALTFFSGALFAGYLYAHLGAHRIGGWHLLVLLTAAPFLPPALGGDPADSAPLGALLLALTRGVFVPFAALSTTSVVMQLWYARVAPAGASTHSLYAASNGGSLLALLAYVLALDRFVGLHAQRTLFTVGYGVYFLVAVALWWRVRGVAPRATAKPGSRPPSDLGRILIWVALAAVPSALLLAVTNVLVFEVGSAPFVWVLPLILYLGSFVFAFGGRPLPRWLARTWPFLAALGAFTAARGEGGGEALSLGVHLVVLGALALVAHAELYRRRAEGAGLTRFYLSVALGGWLGGAFVSLLAPRVFTRLDEYPLALFALASLFAALRWRGLRRVPKSTLAVGLVFLLALGAATQVRPADASDEVVLTRRRSPYGLYRVTELTRDGVRFRELMSGRIVHGRERVGEVSATPLAYYHPSGPLGDLARAHVLRRRVGVVGLGVGAAAATFRDSEQVVFYEIDPAVLELARRHFHFLSDGAPVRLGDARRLLERELRQDASPYDVLLVDAFTGDAVPVHLLTREALQLYARRVTPDGLVLVHVSNIYYDLAAVLGATARAAGLAAVHRVHEGPLVPGQAPSHYFALGKTPEALEALLALGWSRAPSSDDLAPFTDDHADTFGAFLRGQGL